MNRVYDRSVPEDAEIVEMLWQRSDEGLPWVERKYKHLCYRIAMNLLGQHEDAEECVNDVYLAVWDTIPPNRPDSLMAYVGKVTRNIAVNCLRKREAFLTSLSAEDRAIMLRRYYDGDPIEEIAGDMGLRAGTVRVRLHRLRDRLREHLESRGISI